MQNNQLEQNLDVYLQKLKQNQDVLGYLLFSKDGIVIRSSSYSLNENQQNQIASSVANYWVVLKKILLRNIGLSINKTKDNFYDQEIEYITLRTQSQIEYIITCYQEYYLMCIQSCQNNKTVAKKDQITKEENQAKSKENKKTSDED